MTSTTRSTLATVLMIGIAAPAAAQVRTFDVKAQPAVTGIPALAMQAGVQIVAPADQLKSRTTQPVKGRMPVDAALAQLLRGTGLRVGRSAGGVVSLVETPGDAARGTPALNATPDVYADPERPVGVDIVVTARRREEQRVGKRESLQVVDAVGRTAIDDNPARSVADLIRQLPGIVVDNDQGEPRSPQIRGLPYVQVTLAGREIPMAGQRSLDVGDVAVDLLDGIAVYKTPSADMVEGGMSGLIELKLRKPLSYSRAHAAGLLTGIYDQNSRRADPSGDLVVGDRWDTPIGEIGLIVGGGAVTNHFRNAFEQVLNYSRTSRAFDLNRNGVPGEAADSVIAPQGSSSRNMQGLRQRFVGDVQFEWRPSGTLDIDASYFGLRYRDIHAHYLLNITNPATNGLPAAESFTLLPGTTDRIASGTYAGAQVDTIGRYQPTRRAVDQGSIGATWQPSDALRLALHVDYTGSIAKIDQTRVITSAVIPTMTMTSVGHTIRYDIGGIDLMDPAAFRVTRLSENLTRNTSRQWVQRLDLAYIAGDGLIRELQLGGRITEREARQDAGSRNSTPRSGRASNHVIYFGTSFPGYLVSDGFAPSRWTAFDPYRIRGKDALRAALGTPAADVPLDPASRFRFSERTYAGYARALFGFDMGAVPVDGDLGVRVVATDTTSRGFVTGSNGVGPTSATSSYVNALPSATVRFKPTGSLVFRLSGSQTVTRPDFNDLAPGIIVNGDQASAGNPALHAFTSRGGDATLEWYPNGNGYLFAAIFYKDLHGFIQQEARNETVDGSPLTVIRPYNAAATTDRGVEVGLNQRLVFLPGLLRNFGVEMNFTYADVRTAKPTPSSGRTFLNTSRYSYNISGSYEIGRLSSRLNYSRRSRYMATQLESAALNGPGYFSPQDWLDLSLRYRLGAHVDVIANATNLGTPLRYSYVGDTSHPTSVSRPLRRFELGARVRF